MRSGAVAISVGKDARPPPAPPALVVLEQLIDPESPGPVARCDEQQHPGEGIGLRMSS